MIVTALSFLPLAVWTYLLFGRGWFWLCRERDDFVASANDIRRENAPHSWPGVVAIIPARDEADLIARSVGSLLRQDYGGRFSVVVVDDQSADGTAAAALAAARPAGAADRLRIVSGSSLPPGWTGKLWAMRQGLAAIDAGPVAPEYVLFSDADIAYAPHALARLVAIADAKNSVLTSLMVKLRCESAAERWLVPAFVFFFQMLYPFAFVNDPARGTAAAAGGCMLARRATLDAAGGLEALRGALIDDCALGALMKRQGPVWLGLTESVHSLRAYTFADFRRMVARSAFAELRYSPLRLAGAVAGMGLDMSGAAVFRRVCAGRRASGRSARLGDDGAGVGADAASIWTPARRRPRPSRDRRGLCRLHIGLGGAILARARRLLERPDPGPDAGGGPRMTNANEARSGKTHRDENFPVASWLISAERRGPILAFYRFVRAADDVADHPTLSPDRKLALLDGLDAALCGRGAPDPEAEPLRLQLSERGLKPQHALDLLKAFRQDVRKRRYANWAELMDYCALSAAPVGRFVLDVHGEDPTLWPASDALCSALQVINHLQDCAQDYRRLDRVYLPLDTLAAHGASVDMLGEPTAPPSLRDAIAELARRTSELVERGAALVPRIKDMRLAAEIAAIEALARRLARDLESRDPLSQRVHLGKAGFALVGELGVLRFLASALVRSVRAPPKVFRA